MSKELLGKTEEENGRDGEEGTDRLGGIEERCQRMQGCNEEGQGLVRIRFSKRQQGQQEGLLQIQQQQKED